MIKFVAPAGTAGVVDEARDTAPITRKGKPAT